MGITYPIRRMAWIEVYYPDPRRYDGTGTLHIGFEYEELAPGTYRAVLTDGTPWRYRRSAGRWRPARWLGSWRLEYFRLQVAPRLPDGEWLRPYDA
jgi:hypothetical protein